MVYHSTKFLGQLSDLFTGPIGYGLSLLVLLVLSITSLSGQSIDMEELKHRFFSDLTQSQIISLMETLDRSQQLTTAELGAKYNWGYIPPDRTPPVTLAQWWDRQNTRQRREHRIDWFREHYLELDVERAAEELGMKDRLTRLYRSLQSDQDSSTHQFEEVTFPEMDLESGESESTEASQSAGERVTRDRQDQNGSAESASKPQPDPESETELEPEPDTPAQEADTGPEKPTWQKEVQIGDQTVIYERVGDDIRVVRGSADYSHLESEPDYEFPFQDEQPSLPVDDLPELRSDTDLPLPGLRFYRSGNNNGSPNQPLLRQ